METYTYCTAQEFKTDISELCEQCPLKDKIEQAIQDQIIFQAKEKKQIYTKSQFDKYIENEISAAEKSMNKVFLIEKQQGSANDNYRQNRIETYIWNKERIKALNLELKNEGIHKIYAWGKKHNWLIGVILALIGLMIALL